MSAFSRAWLELREATDMAARNAEIADAVASRFALREAVDVIDLGCGTGANLRATAPLLPNQQTWRLIDKDASLVEAARAELRRWSDSSEADGDALILTKGHARLRVTFDTMDLNGALETVFIEAPGLVTASALFDLASEDFIKRLARLTVAHKAAFYAVLTFNGTQRFTPHRPADNRIAAAFHKHQLSDKGFGPAAGPTATAVLSDAFKIGGYIVMEGDSSWQLSASDRMLIGEIVRGYAFAAAETGDIDNRTIEDWVKVNRTRAEIGHTDTFAVPA